MTPPTTGSCVNATGAGARTSTYTVSASDVGYALAVNVTATNGGGSVSTTATGSCDTGLMTTAWNASTNPRSPIASTYFDNGESGCSPISAVVGTGQYGAGTAGEHFCTNAPITCGFADIANAGVPRGTALYAVPGTCTSPSGPGAGCGATGSGWSYSGGHITLGSGAVLQDVSFDAGSDTNDSITISGSTSNVTIQDSDLSGGCNCNYESAGGIITLSGSGRTGASQGKALEQVTRSSKWARAWAELAVTISRSAAEIRLLATSAAGLGVVGRLPTPAPDAPPAPCGVPPAPRACRRSCRSARPARSTHFPSPRESRSVWPLSRPSSLP